MNPEVQRIFEAVADLDAAARQAYFARNVPEPAVRREVESLLAHDRPSDDSLRLPIVRLIESEPEFAETAFLPRRCGPYELKQLIGRGGMGAVYRAERVDGEVRRDVAVKVLLGGFGDPAARQRFLQERQILAGLTHANIAALLDAGHTGDGQPYFVMELVAGRPIDEFCEPLHPRQKIELFLKVCEAVSFAHSRLIVHRDLKPGNILVTAEGVPKLLDFGIAKMLGIDTGVTLTLQRVMTLAYGSPEQALGGEITTASDTYSLGAVLYKMLTGHAPHPAGPSPEAVLAAVRTRDVPRASKFKPELAGDLDAILSKALRKEPSQRYGTVEQLAGDLRDFLRFRPVRARQGDLAYRAAKFMRRHWIPLTAALVVAVALAAGLAIAWRARQLAERRFEIARQMANHLFAVEDQVRGLAGSTGVRQYIADTTLRYLNELGREARERDLLLELGEAYRRTAGVLSRRGGSSLGRDADALKALDSGSRLLDKALAARPNDRPVLRAAIQNRMETVMLLSDKDEPQRVAGLARGLAPLVDRLAAGAAPDDLRLAAIAYGDIRRAWTNLDQMEPARRYAQLSIDNFRRYFEAVRTPAAAMEYGTGLRRHASYLRYAGQLEESLAALEEARQVIGALPEDKPQQAELSAVLYYIGVVNSDADMLGLGRREAAIAALEKSVALSRKLMTADQRDHSARVDFVQAEVWLAQLLQRDRPADAIRLYDEAWNVMRAAPPGAFLRDEYMIRAAAESTFALRQVGRETEARARLERVRALFFAGQDPLGMRIGPFTPLESYMRAQAEMDAGAGRVGQAIETYRLMLRRFEALEYRPRESLADGLALSRKQARLAQLLRQAGDTAGAAQYAADRVELWRHWNQRLPGNAFVRGELSDAEHEMSAAR